MRRIYLLVLALSSVASGQTFSNLDDSLTNWASCGQSPGFCAGGQLSATAFSQTINNASPSQDGAAMLISVTGPAGSGGQTTNYLWYYKPGANNAANTFVGTWNVNLPSLAITTALEYDIGHFDAGIRFMMGSQCIVGGNWQIWDSCNGAWHDASPTLACSLSTNSYHSIVWNTHHDLLASAKCAGGNPCMHYDLLTIDSTPHGPFQDYPACASGDADNVAFQMQIDINNSGGTVTEYLDNLSLTISKPAGRPSVFAIGL